MSVFWSTMCQGINTLHTSRKLRFNKKFENKFVDCFDLKNPKNILEIGCGTGALCESLFDWYNDAKIFGIDRDVNFINFAKTQNPGIKYTVADATKLPFEENSFDVTISNTVCEHIEPSAFFKEQFRILNKGGVCLVLTSRKGINHRTNYVGEQSEFEKGLWKKADQFFCDSDKSNLVAAYAATEQELPKIMEKFGFKNVSTHYVQINLTPDSSEYDKDFAFQILESERACSTDAANSLKQLPNNQISEQEIDKLIAEINAKYEKRFSDYEKGIKHWDCFVSNIMILRGEKY